MTEHEGPFETSIFESALGAETVPAERAAALYLRLWNELELSGQPSEANGRASVNCPYAFEIMRPTDELMYAKVCRLVGEDRVRVVLDDNPGLAIHADTLEAMYFIPNNQGAALLVGDIVVPRQNDPQDLGVAAQIIDGIVKKGKAAREAAAKTAQQGEHSSQESKAAAAVAAVAAIGLLAGGLAIAVLDDPEPLGGYLEADLDVVNDRNTLAPGDTAQPLYAGELAQQNGLSAANIPDLSYTDVTGRPIERQVDALHATDDLTEVWLEPRTDQVSIEIGDVEAANRILVWTDARRGEQFTVTRTEDDRLIVSSGGAQLLDRRVRVVLDDEGYFEDPNTGPIMRPGVTITQG